MPKSKYELIYKDLKDKIDRKEYKEGTFLPPENTLVQQYDCSRNTIRRAISHLVMEGSVQPRHGTGVRVRQKAPQPQPSYQIRVPCQDKGHYLYRTYCG